MQLRYLIYKWMFIAWSVKTIWKFLEETDKSDK